MTISSIESMMHVFLCIAHCSEGDQDTGMFSITTVLLITMRKKGGSSCVVLPPSADLLNTLLPFRGPSLHPAVALMLTVLQFNMCHCNGQCRIEHCAMQTLVEFHTVQ